MKRWKEILKLGYEETIKWLVSNGLSFWVLPTLIFFYTQFGLPQLLYKLAATVGFAGLLIIVAAVLRIWYISIFPLSIEYGKYYLGMTGEDGTDMRVQGFQAKVRNRSWLFFDTASGYIRSNKTGEQFPMYLIVDGEYRLPNETNGIPSYCEFMIGCPLKRKREEFSIPGAGMKWEHFLRDFGDFIFHAQFGSKMFEKKFGIRQHKRVVDAFLNSMISRGQKPRITLKKPHVTGA
jgi:hypothetical protein